MKTSEEAAGMPRRRSTRLRSQFHPSEEDAGMRPRLHPQTQASEEGARLTCRRSPRLHSQIQAGEDGAGVTRRIRRRRGTSQAADASLPDDDDMLREILLRLPPQPSSLPRASAVCKRWWGLVTDPKFHQQFYAHHRKLPLLGAFVRSSKGTVFAPMLDAPDRIPPQRFNIFSHKHGRVLDCRHGRVLVKDALVQTEVAVCDPITGEQHLVTIPSEFRGAFLEGAVMCAAADHVHGRCHSSPFKVILVTHDKPPLACVYSSETGLWGNPIRTEAACQIYWRPAALVGNCLYWLTFSDDMLVVDLDANSLTVISEPDITKGIDFGNRQIFQAEDGAVGFAILSYPHFQMCRMNVNATWMPQMTIEMHRIPGLPPRIEKGEYASLWGYDEDTDSLFLDVGRNVYGVQLKLMQSRKLYETDRVHGFNILKSFYTPGTAIAGGPNAAEG
uniref:Uncharacterized protein n=2 Tax=Avena sativa TaxID=4498 RepID=A0ACD5VIT4_AVESA